MERKIPFNEYAHIDPMTIAFVLSLRDQPPGEDLTSNLSEDDRKLLEAETAPLRKGQTNCRSKNCKDVKIALQAAILDGAHAKKDTKKFEEDIEIQAEQANAVQEQIDIVENEQNSISKEISQINSVFNEKAMHLKSIKHKNNQLTIKIAKAEKYLKRLQSVLNNNSLSGSSVSSSSFRTGSGGRSLGESDDATESGTVYERYKHTGTYSYVEAKRAICWSCCLNELYKCKPCITQYVVHLL